MLNNSSAIQTGTMNLVDWSNINYLLLNGTINGYDTSRWDGFVIVGVCTNLDDGSSGNSTFDIKVQHSADRTNWKDLGAALAQFTTAAVAAGGGKQVETLQFPATTGAQLSAQFIRLVAIAGTAANNVSIAVSISPKLK